MAAPSSTKDRFYEKVINPYHPRVMKHPQAIEMQEGSHHNLDVQGPKTTGSMESKLEAREQEVLLCKGMLIAYGGATFVSALIKHGLIDEFHLFVNPAAIGNGMAIFKELDSKQNLNLVKAIPFDCGIVVLNYEPKRD
jgi:dihydrofolate reductase